MMLRTRRPGSAGFTLIEMMVVIAIIALLVSLLMAAVIRVKDSGQQTDNIDRITQIGAAIGEAKTKNNMPYVWSGPFNLKSVYQASDPELDILLTMFPQMAWANSQPAGNNGYTGPNVTLDSNQALLLLLTGGYPTQYTGFSTNPAQPFATGGSARKGPYLQVNSKMYLPPANDATQLPIAPLGYSLNTLAPGHAWLIDPYRVPYAVFAATKGKPPTALPAPYSINANPATGAQTIYGLTPYVFGGKYLNENGFQIISAGKDRTFGTTGILPATDAGFDDQTNFSKSLLGYYSN